MQQIKAMANTKICYGKNKNNRMCTDREQGYWYRRYTIEQMYHFEMGSGETMSY